MKNILNTKLLVFSIIVFAFTSCDQDDSLPNTPLENTTNAIILEENLDVTETSDASFRIVQENLVEPKLDFWEAFDEVSGQIGIRVVGGTATQGVDFDFSIPSIQDFSPFLLQDGYYFSYDASVSLENDIPLSDVIDIFDDGEVEGSETIVLQFYPIALGYIIIDDQITITITD